MAKSRRASAKGKGKKGSAKKGSAKSRAAPAEPEEPELQWPWTPFIRAWMAPGSHNRKQMIESFRSHYVYSDGGTCSANEWNKIIKHYCYPLGVAHEESLVQLLAIVLGREATRKVAADNVDDLTSALRFRHTGDHYARMLAEMERWFGMLDNPAALGHLLEFIHTMGNVLTVDDLRIFLEKACIVTLGKPQELQDDDDDLFSFVSGNDQFHVLDEYLKEKRLRLVDLFRIFDRDSDGTLTPTEIRMGLENAGVAMSSYSFDMLMKELDHDGDGVVDFKEMMTTRRRSRELNRRLSKRVDSEMEDILEEESPESEGTAKAELNQSEQPAEGAVQGVGDDTEAPDIKVPFLQLDLEGLTDFLLHCHYVTRP